MAQETACELCSATYGCCLQNIDKEPNVSAQECYWIVPGCVQIFVIENKCCKAHRLEGMLQQKMC